MHFATISNVIRDETTDVLARLIMHCQHNAIIAM